MSQDLFDDPFDDEIVDSGKEKDDVETPQEKPTLEELKVRLRNRRIADRQARIGNIQSKKISKPMTRIYFCENLPCTKIMRHGEQKVCATCKVFVYCSKECQIADWHEVHKTICGKDVDEEHLTTRNQFIEANQAAGKVETAACHGKHITVLHDKDKNAPACIFSTISHKSNVLHFSDFSGKNGKGGNPIFTTTDYDTLGDFSVKIKAAQEMFPDKKIFIISVLLDRVKKDQSTKCVLRMYLSHDDSYGQTMAAPKGTNGQPVKTVKKFQRVKK